MKQALAGVSPRALIVHGYGTVAAHRGSGRKALGPFNRPTTNCKGIKGLMPTRKGRKHRSGSHRSSGAPFQQRRGAVVIAAGLAAVLSALAIALALTRG